MTPSRRHQIALFGAVLPLAAFLASPAAAATSTPMHHKPTTHHVAHATHKVTTHHSSSVHHVAHHTTHHPVHKPTLS